MEEIFVQRKYKSLVPISLVDEEKIIKFPTHKVLRAKIYGLKKPRSLRQLNLYWATCQTVADNTEDKWWNTKEKVAFQCKVALNFIKVDETIVDTDGRVHFAYRSISFEELEHIEACNFFDKAWPIMADKIGVTVEQLLENTHP